MPELVGVGQHGPELVFALVSPVGTPTDRLLQRLAGDLLAYGYRVEPIKLSGLLMRHVLAEGRGVPSEPEDARVGALIDEADRLCEGSREAAAVALLGVAEMRTLRADRHEADGAEGDRGELQDRALERTAWVIDSIKRPAEVERLRQTYGDHLVLVGLKASEETRRRRLVDMMRPSRSSMLQDELEAAADGLIKRDLDEKGEFGQNTLRAFPMSDVFVDVDVDVEGQVTRLLELLFGSPDFPVPTVEEYGMHLAHVSSTRTGELGLKVGAAVLRGDGSVVALGVNQHPTPSGSPLYDASAVDIRALVIDTLRRLGEDLGADVRGRLEEDAEGLAREVLAGPLRGSRVADLIEFQPTVHAEMDALVGALRGSHSVEGATVYVTAYPCHNCAKHLVALGLEVRYLEPYPKSRAFAMYGKAVEGTFQPFTGVAPRRYEQLFDTTGDRKAADGSRKPWKQLDKSVAQPRVDPFVDQRGIADREVLALASLSTGGTTGDLVPPAVRSVGGRGQDDGGASATAAAAETERPDGGSLGAAGGADKVGGDDEGSVPR